MKLKKSFNTKFWKYDSKKYNAFLEYDKNLYMHWTGKRSLNCTDFSTIEWKYLKCLRKAQSNMGNIWGKLYTKKLACITKKTGIWIPAEISCGKGIIIAHWGRIIINPQTIIGNDFSISSGAVIGRDIRGNRKGVPRLGNQVVIKTNAVVVGNVRIGNDVLIAPNAYVNFDVPDHSVVVGNPGVIYPKENATEGYI